MITINAQALGKKYGTNRLFKGIDLELSQPGAYAITGFNGTGKSTLLLCIAGYITPSEGKIIWTENNKSLTEYHSCFAFCSPAMNLFEELTMEEQLNFHHKFVKTFDLKKAIASVQDFGLQKALQKPIKSFSSGMKQRLKLLMCFFNDVPVLLLDEPCSNLDEQGIVLYQREIEKSVGKKLILVATNQENTEFPIKGTLINIDEFKSLKK